MSQTALVIGFGAAAVNAIIALRNSGYAGKIRVLAKEETLPYAPVLTSYVAGGSKEADDCALFTQEQLDRLEVEVVYDCEVTAIDPSTRTVITHGTSYPYDVCLIATGSRPTITGFPAEDRVICCTLRTMGDACTLAASLAGKDTQRVLVSGTSMVALKTVEACLERGVKVTLLGRSEHILKASALPQTAQAFEDCLAAKGVELRLGQTAVEAHPGADGGADISFSDGSTQHFDDVIVAHGMRPNLDFIGSALECCDGLAVDEHMRTSDESIYAAGDVARVIDLSAGLDADGKPVTRRAGIWKEACVQGCVAGRAMAAQLAGSTPELSYPGFIPNNTVYVGPTTLVSGGSIALEGERYVAMTQTEGGFIAAVYEPADGPCDKLVGYNVFNAAGKPGSHVFDEGCAYFRRLKEELGLSEEISLNEASRPEQHRYAPAEGDLLANAGLFREFAGHCAECGRCTKSCASLSAAGLSLGGIAKGGCGQKV